MFLIIFIVYYSIGTFLLCNILFDSSFNLVLINKKTNEIIKPTTDLLMFFCFFWIITIPLLIFKGEKENG